MQLLKTKLYRANGLLAKIRHFVSKNLLGTIYFAILGSHLQYGCQIWGQKDSQELKNITITQNKGLRILNFKGPPLEHSRPLYKNSKILKLMDIIKLNNIIFVFDQITINLNAFENYFQLKRQQHNHFTSGKILNVLPQVNTSLYGSNSISLSAIRDWNALHGQSGLKLISPAIFRGKVTSIIKWFLNNYI